MANADLRSTLEKLSQMGEHARIALQLFDEVAANGGAPSAASNGHVDLPALKLNRNGSKKMLPTVARHCEVAYEILTEAKRPLHKDEILKRMQTLDKTNLKASNSVAFYLRQDDRFKTLGQGMFGLNKAAG